MVGSTPLVLRQQPFTSSYHLLSLPGTGLRTLHLLLKKILSQVHVFTFCHEDSPVQGVKAVCPRSHIQQDCFNQGLSTSKALALLPLQIFIFRKRKCSGCRQFVLSIRLATTCQQLKKNTHNQGRSGSEACTLTHCWWKCSWNDLSGMIFDNVYQKSHPLTQCISKNLKGLV